MSAGTELVAAFVGRWPAPATAPLSARAGDDPFGAVAHWLDAPATGAGALSGHTLAVKANIAVAGAPTAVGTGATSFTPARDAAIVARARAAGARVCAISQCEALLTGANSFTSRPAPVRNPRDPARSAGGSSSGSAAMVAAGLADLALGTDSGGSIRIPAALCGVVGFKPTRGRVPYTGIAPLDPFLEHAGPIARDVGGAAALYRVITGPDGVDSRQGWSSITPARPANDPPRLGLLTDAAALAEPAVSAVFGQGCERLAAAGSQVESVRWPALAEAAEIHLAIYGAGQWLTLAALPAHATAPDGFAAWRAALPADAIPPALAEALALGKALVGADPGLYTRAVARASALADELDALFARNDALLLPTTPGVAPPIPASPTDDDIWGDTRLTAPFNVTGHPALSLPCGAVDGLPIGLQLVGRRGDDEALLDLAATVERALALTAAPSGAPA